MSKEAGIIEDFSPDDETPEIFTDLSEIFYKIPQEVTPNNQPTEVQKDNPFALDSLPHMRFITQERQNRLNSQPTDQSRGKYSGLGFQTIDQPYIGHQN